MTAAKSGHSPPASITVVKRASVAGPMRTPTPALFSQVDGEAEVLTGQCRREPTWMRGIEQTVQPKIAGKTENRTVGKKGSQELVGDCLPSGRGNGLGKRSHPCNQQRVGQDLHGGPRSTGPQCV